MYYTYKRRKTPPRSGRNPGSAHAAPVESAADQPGKEKPPTSWGDRQLCQSRRPSPESRKVIRAKVAKLLGIVVSYSRKSRESRSVLRVIVAGRTNHIFQILLLQVLGGNLISELLVGCQHDLLLVRIAEMVLHEEDRCDRVDLSVLCVIFHLCVQKLIRFFYEVTACGG